MPPDVGVEEELKQLKVVYQRAQESLKALRDHDESLLEEDGLSEADKKAMLMALRKSIKQKTAEVEAQQLELAAQKAEIESLETERDAAKKTLEFATAKAGELEIENADLRRRQALADAEEQGLLDKVAALEEQVAQLIKEKDDMRAWAEEQVQQAHESLDEVSSQEALLVAKWQALQDQIDELEVPQAQRDYDGAASPEASLAAELAGDQKPFKLYAQKLQIYLLMQSMKLSGQYKHQALQMSLLGRSFSRRVSDVFSPTLLKAGPTLKEQALLDQLKTLLSSGEGADFSIQSLAAASRCFIGLLMHQTAYRQALFDLMQFRLDFLERLKKQWSFPREFAEKLGELKKQRATLKTELSAASAVESVEEKGGSLPVLLEFITVLEEQQIIMQEHVVQADSDDQVVFAELQYVLHRLRALKTLLEKPKVLPAPSFSVLEHAKPVESDSAELGFYSSALIALSSVEQAYWGSSCVLDLDVVPEALKSACLSGDGEKKFARLDEFEGPAQVAFFSYILKSPETQFSMGGIDFTDIEAVDPVLRGNPTA